LKLNFLINSRSQSPRKDNRGAGQKDPKNYSDSPKSPSPRLRAERNDSYPVGSPRRGGGHRSPSPNHWSPDGTFAPGKVTLPWTGNLGCEFWKHAPQMWMLLCNMRSSELSDALLNAGYPVAKETSFPNNTDGYRITSVKIGFWILKAALLVVSDYA
jgi:hypothetical protein